MTLFHGNAIPSATGYDIANSCRFNDDDSSYTSFTPSSNGNRKTWTWSGWIKRGNTGSTRGGAAAYQGIWLVGVNGNESTIKWFINDKIDIDNYTSGTHNFHLKTTAVYSDVSNWYHVVVAFDTTQGTASNRIKLYVNGSQVTVFDQADYPAQNYDTQNNSTSYAHMHGRDGSGSQKLDGYLAEVHYVDGTAYTATAFGEVDEDYGHWKPIKFEGNYGTNGFHLDFKNSGSLGNDANGSNNSSVTNLATHDQMLDSPTNNFCVINHLDAPVSSNDLFKEGNLRFDNNVNADASMKRSTFSMESGKWYWEVLKLAGTDTGTTMGIMPAPAGNKVNNYIGAAASSTATGGGIGFYSGGSATLGDGGTVHGSAFSQAAGDIMMFAYDADTGKMWVGLNGTWRDSGNPSTLVNAWATFSDTSPKSPAFQAHNGTRYIANFGQEGTFAGETTAGGNPDTNGHGNFKYTVPTNFKSLCSKNLPSPTVTPQDYFNTVLYTGNGSGQSITGVGFQPDWIWIKARNTSSYNPEVYDSVRGVHNSIATAAPGVEYSSNTTVTAFNSDGWSMGNNHAGINNNGTTFVAWNWKAGGTASSNTDGTITSTVSANTTAGFSIVKWAGDSSVSATVGHGLGSQLSMIICKERNGSDWWHVWSAGLSGNSYNAFLNNDNAQRASISDGHVEKLNNTTTFGFETTSNVNAVNQSGINNIAYCFAAKDGYSKMGSYLANDSTDGTMIYTGFRPAFIMVKRIDTAGTGWIMMDNVRDTYNVMNNNLRADTSDAENTARATMPVDFLSNGFKWRINYSDVNGSTGGTYHTYAYYAVAEQPFKHSNAR